MRCPHCDEIVPDNAQTCPECGKDLPAFGVDIVEEKAKAKREWTKDDTRAILSVFFPCFSFFVLSPVGLILALMSFKKAKYRWTAILGLALSAFGIAALATMIPLLIIFH